jgi:hypothetical protein
MITFANLNGLQLWALFAITTCAVLIIGGLAVQSWKESRQGLRWDYRGASVRDTADAPIVLLVVAYLRETFVFFADICNGLVKFLRSDFLVVLGVVVLIVTFPVSFPVMGYLHRHRARKQVIAEQKRDLKARAYA